MKYLVATWDEEEGKSYVQVDVHVLEACVD